MNDARLLFKSLYRLEEIRSRIYDIEFQLHFAKKDLKEENLGLQLCILELISSLPLPKAQYIADKLYWRSEEMASPVSRAWKEAYRTKLKVGPRVRGCSTKACLQPVFAYSWSSFKKLSSDDERKCDGCVKRISEERQSRHVLQSRARENRLIELRFMKYQDYLLTTEWQETRASALRRARFHCQMCGKSKPLQVHHNNYERRGQENSSDVIAICADCHGKFHDKITVEKVN